jgi:hypothetical protein
MKSFTLVSCIGLMAFSVANAQETHKFTADFGGGFTVSAGNTGRYLDNGWNVRGGVGYNLSPYLGANLNLGFDSMGINSTTLSSVGVPGGDVHIFHATIDPVVHLNPKGKVDFYVTAGGGMFHRYQEFTAPTVVSTTAFIPFFGFYPAAVGATQVLASYTVTKPGYDVGAGLSFGALGHGKFFAEAKYNHMFLNNGHTDYIPVTFGFRW